jgi:hypothetical protein
MSKMLKFESKDIESCKTKMPAYIQREAHKNHFRPLSTNPKSQENMDQYNSSSETE